MGSSLIFGVVVNHILYSNRIELKTAMDNGIYSLDMSQDDFPSTIAPANIEDARKYFAKASKVNVIRGIAFHDGIIPENPVSYPKLPIKVIDATYEDFEEVEVAIVKGKVCYYLQTVSTSKAYILMDLKENLDKKKPVNIDMIKGVTPEMRMVYTFHFLEKENERKRKEMLEPVNAIKTVMAGTGAMVKSVKKNNQGFEVVWSFGNNTINSLLDKNFRVISAGFCVSGHDRTQSARSVVNLLKDYVQEGSRINLTRVGVSNNDHVHDDDYDDDYDD